jgi:hypothetical protein
MLVLTDWAENGRWRLPVTTGVLREERVGRRRSLIRRGGADRRGEAGPGTCSRGDGSGSADVGVTGLRARGPRVGDGQ